MSHTQASQPLQPSALPFETPPSPQGPAKPHSQRSVPRWRALIGALLHPSGANPQDIAFIPWIVTLAVSAGAFGLFFLQIGLDRADAGWSTRSQPIVMLLLGLLYGTLGVLVLALIAWIILRVSGAKPKAGSVIRAFTLAYSPTLVALILGLVARALLGWRTAAAFGVPGMLWALGTMNSTLRRLSGGKTGLSVVLASVCGAVLLLGWGLLGGGP
mgnify:FL=1